MQSGYSPMGGMDSWNPPISFPVNQDNLKWKDEKANTGLLLQRGDDELRVITKKFRNGTIRGSLRWQYEFLIPKYPIGTFSIYSCLGEATSGRSLFADAKKAAAPSLPGRPLRLCSRPLPGRRP